MPHSAAGLAFEAAAVTTASLELNGGPNARALEARGHRVDLHVGRSDEHRVSLAIVDPTTPQRWKLGIELDGVFHGAAPTVLDREAVRPGVLKVLGWKTLRVSSLDWFLDPARTVERIENALGGA